jgi:hypothetical protein
MLSTGVDNSKTRAKFSAYRGSSAPISTKRMPGLFMFPQWSRARNGEIFGTSVKATCNKNFSREIQKEFS